jgi:hypothetical protein
MRLRAAALPPIVLAAALMGPGACGAGGTSSDTGKFAGTEKNVAQAVYDLRDAVASRDAKKICDTYVTQELQRRLTALAKQTHRGSTCADQLKDSIQDVDATDLKVTDVQVNGNSATVRITTDLTSGKDPTDTLQLRNERGWRLSGL